MSVKIVKDGKEVGIREVIDYLERQYGIPSGHICAVSVSGEVGKPIKVTATLYMREDKPVLSGNVEPLAPEEYGEVPLNHPGSDRWTGGDRKDER